MLKVLVGYPSTTEEFVIVERMTSALQDVQSVLSIEETVALQRQADSVYVDPALIEYSVRLVTATRQPELCGLQELKRYLLFGASPRASINMIIAGPGLGFCARARLRPPGGRSRRGPRCDEAPSRTLIRGAFRQRR